MVKGSGYRTDRHSLVPSDFTQVKERGFTFGAPREAFNKVFTKTQPIMPDPDMPGPGAYHVQSFVEKIQNDSRSFIMGKKDTYEFRK